MQIIQSNFIDIPNREIYAAIIAIENGKIKSVKKSEATFETYILPGFVDAHVHIESSMLVPTEFAKKAVIHGTVATVSDPHEIANVLGKEGVYYMIENGKKCPFKFNFGAPSCVPATKFETAGAEVTVEDIDELMALEEIKYLAEMMNYPGVLFQDKMVMDKIAVAKKYNNPVDGHAPGLSGEKAIQYISAGISTDHECFTYEEAKFKLDHGMKVLIREGSAAKNFEALIDLLNDYPDDIMFCSDDKHPDDLLIGHINLLVKRALVKGIDLFKVLQAACINPVLHYKLDVGLLKENDPADFILINNLDDFDILETYINGNLVAKNGTSFIETSPEKIVNNFDIDFKETSAFEIQLEHTKVKAIEVIDGQLITKTHIGNILLDAQGNAVSNMEDDILKVAVINRYYDTPVAVAFIKNFGLKRGALASSVAHDSHNIIAVGCNDGDLFAAVKAVERMSGGLAAVCNGELLAGLPLPIAGLMSDQPLAGVARGWEEMRRAARDLGSVPEEPFMVLSFLALPVIPELKLTDQGLVDVNLFRHIPLFAAA